MDRTPTLSEFLGLHARDDRGAMAHVYALAAELKVEIGDDFTDAVLEIKGKLDALTPDERTALITRTRSAPPSVVTGKVSDDHPELSPTLTICKVCRLGLTVFTDARGVTTWRHSRSWVVQDHDPVPIEVTRDTPRPQICDFCGREELLNWQYKGKRIRDYDPIEHADNDYGFAWMSCETCASYIDVGDVEGLIDRNMRNTPFPLGTSVENLQTIRARLLNLHGEFVPSIYERRWLGPPQPLPVMHPRQIPKIRDSVIKMWRSEMIFDNYRHSSKIMGLPGFCYGLDIDEALDSGGEEAVMRAFRTREPGTSFTPEVFGRWVDHVSIGLMASELYYISPEFTQLAIQSGMDLPDISITREELPSANGFLIWADPVGEIQREDDSAGIRAVSWTLVPRGVWVTVYFQPEDGTRLHPVGGSIRAGIGWLVAPNPGLGFVFLQDSLKRPDAQVATANVITTLLATWFLLRQPGVATVTEQPADKALTRAYKRAGRPSPSVQIVDLRRHVQAARETPDPVERRRIGVRFMVRGHWKRQAYGPKRGLRKTIYVAPFLKGPDTAPLKTNRPVVKVLR